MADSAAGNFRILALLCRGQVVLLCYADLSGFPGLEWWRWLLHAPGGLKVELKCSLLTVQESQVKLLVLRKTQVLKSCIRQSKTVLP